VSARLLALVMPGQEHAALAALPALVATARGAGAAIRLACFRPLPAPRQDRHGRVVVGVARGARRSSRARPGGLTSLRRSRVAGRWGRSAIS